MIERDGLCKAARRCAGGLVMAMASLALAATPARADLIVNVQSVSAFRGTTGNTLDVTLTNTGSAVAIGGFSFALTTAAGSGVTFTGADIVTATATYIFAGHSLFGPTISTTTGATLTASDLYDVPLAGATLATGATVGLGRVFFNVASTGPAQVAVSLSSFPATSLSDPDGTPFPAAGVRLVGGTITTAIPEPGPLLLSTVALVAAGLVGRLRR